MANKVITFTLGAEGAISPTTEQKAGVQGSHNVTEVRFEVSKIDATENTEFRIQFIDGAGGFYSTGFLDEVTEGDKRYVSTMLPDDVTNAGGLAFAYLVVSEIVGETEDKVLMSDGGKLRFGFAGVGSPSEYAYRTRISNALVNAEIFVGQAEDFSEQAKGYKDDAEVAKTNASASASSASASAEEASDLLQELKNGIANGDFKGEPGPQGPQGIQGDKGDKGEPGETPDLTGYISMWQPNTEYKFGDVCYWDHLANEYPSGHSVFLKCKFDHTSSEYSDPLPDLSNWIVLEITADKSICDVFGKVIHETYATKEEVGNIETALDNIITIQNQLIGGDA